MGVSPPISLDNDHAKRGLTSESNFIRAAKIQGRAVKGALDKALDTMCARIRVVALQVFAFVQKVVHAICKA